MSIMRSAAATGRDHPHNGLETEIVDLKAIDCDQPGVQVFALQNEFARKYYTQGPAVGGKEGAGGGSTLKSAEKD
jgi:hypothetical protein